MNFEIFKMNIEKLQFLLLVLIATVLPYWNLYSYLFSHLVIILFISILITNNSNAILFLKNKTILSLSGFIVFTYVSFLWSPAENVFNEEYFQNFDRFKYYFLLIPGIYFSSLTLVKIERLLLVMALASSYTAIIYYLNAFSITSIYSFQFSGNSEFFMHYLVQNFFLLTSSIYFYVKSFDEFKKKEHKKMFVFILLTLFFVISMFIDPKTTGRLMLVAFIPVFILIPLLYMKKWNAILAFILSIFISGVFVLNNEKIQHGLDVVEVAISEGKYTGSWGHRLGFSIVGYKIFKENPIIGRGISDTYPQVLKFAKENPVYFIGDGNRHFHNEHINLLVQVGLVGYSLFLLFIYKLFQINLKNKTIKYLNISFIIMFLVLMLGEHYLWFKTCTAYFSMWVGIVLLYQKKEKESLESTGK